MGRSNDYKNNAACLHISDLKVPKKYIRIVTGPQADCDASQSPKEASRTPLRVVFFSICTTDINGTRYKLKAKGDVPLDVSFDVPQLMLTVNANKGDLIQILLSWREVLVLAVSADTGASDAQKRLQQTQARGLDVQTCQDAYTASVCVALTPPNSADYNLRVCVLRGIAVAIPTFLDHMLANLRDLTWLDVPQLLRVPPDLLLSCSYSKPVPHRSTLLQGQCAITIYNEASQGRNARLVAWLQCLLPDSVLSIAIDRPDSVAELSSVTVGVEGVLVFGVDPEQSPDYSGLPSLPPECSFVQVNTEDELWNAIVAVTCSGLRRTTRPKRISGPDPRVRKRRRLVERVSDTDFFLFMLSAAPTQTQPSHEATQEPMQLKAGLPEAGHEVEREAGNVEQEAGGAAAVQTRHATLQKPPQAEITETKPENQTRESLPPSLKKQRRPVSFVDAVKNTKLKAEQGIKYELDDGGPIEKAIDALVLVEEFVLVPRKQPLVVCSDERYAGRRDFKTFRKTRPLWRTTRAYIPLVSAEQSGVGGPVVQVSYSARVENNLAGEMDPVRGYRPESQALFVPEDSCKRETSFVDPGGTGGPTVDDSDSDDGDVRFRFST